DHSVFPFATLFHGHKSSDVDHFEGEVPLSSNVVSLGKTTLVFPLADWTDTDVWDYIFDNHLPFQKERYGDGQGELADKWHNNDYVHACTRCIDPRNKSDEV